MGTKQNKTKQKAGSVVDMAGLIVDLAMLRLSLKATEIGVRVGLKPSDQFVVEHTLPDGVNVGADSNKVAVYLLKKIAMSQLLQKNEFERCADLMLDEVRKVEIKITVIPQKTEMLF